METGSHHRRSDQSVRWALSTRCAMGWSRRPEGPPAVSQRNDRDAWRKPHRPPRRRRPDDYLVLPTSSALLVRSDWSAPANPSVGGTEYWLAGSLQSERTRSAELVANAIHRTK